MAVALLPADPEFKAAMARFPKMQIPTCQTAHDVREMADVVLMAMALGMGPAPDGVRVDRLAVRSTHDGAEISVYRFAGEAARARRGPGPALVYMHGGGLVAGSVEAFVPMIGQLSDAAALPIFAVEYRLAPEHPAPAGLEDTYAAVAYVSGHAAELGVDPARIAVMGDSAGACHAAGVAILARDRRLRPPLARQILLQPMLDDLTIRRPVSPGLAPHLIWRAGDNRIGWTAYLGERVAGNPDAAAPGPDGVVPARVRDLAGLPRAYIDIGSLDLFHDEAVEYARRMAQAGVEVEVRLWAGVPHGFDNLARGTKLMERVTRARIGAFDF